LDGERFIGGSTLLLVFPQRSSWMSSSWVVGTGGLFFGGGGASYFGLGFGWHGYSFLLPTIRKFQSKSE